MVEILDVDQCLNPVVMVGGLWSLSPAMFPKQSQQLVDNEHGYALLLKIFSSLS